jgi:hypothetical protein
LYAWKRIDRPGHEGEVGMDTLDAAAASTLIIVACHSTYLGGESADRLSDASWVLEPFQKGEPRIFLEHAVRGLELARLEQRSVLVFSGGQTKKVAGPISEAQSYWSLCQELGLFADGLIVERVTTEEFACDSFQNLLFSICRFREYVGRYPETIRLVSWGFKRDRFGGHRDALRWPAKRFYYEAVGEPLDAHSARLSEDLVSREFAADPYGSMGDLFAKRASRNPFRRFPPYGESCPELLPLLRFKGPGIFDGSLPWDPNHRSTTPT